MAFKFNEKRKAHTPWDTPMKFGRSVIKKTDLEGNTLGEANMDGSISVDESVDLDSPLGKRIVAHEQSHVDDIESGRASYDDNWVTWEGKRYPRKNGKIFHKGKWKPEGDRTLDWEIKAMQAEKGV